MSVKDHLFDVIYYVSSFVFMAVAGSINIGILQTPWYHSGWFYYRTGWLLLSLVVAILSIVACFTKSGLWIVLLLTLILSLCFVAIYDNSYVSSPDWRTAGWVLHNLVISLLVGVFARGIAEIAIMLGFISAPSNR